MDRIRIRGGRRLHGEIQISGAKNAALPLMTAALLTAEPLHLANVPDLVDIATMTSLLSQLGTTVAVTEPVAGATTSIRGMRLQASGITDTTAPYDLVRRCVLRCWCWDCSCALREAVSLLAARHRHAPG
jgi:UDP-N-acetylglucosamine 1-carboxyvinyltransferase